MPQVEWTDENRKYAMCFFPLVGAVIGALIWLWLLVCRWLEINALIQGAVGAVVPLLVTGGIHMDGFMDTADALASWALEGAEGYAFASQLFFGGNARDEEAGVLPAAASITSTAMSVSMSSA